MLNINRGLSILVAASAVAVLGAGANMGRAQSLGKADVSSGTSTEPVYQDLYDFGFLQSDFGDQNGPVRSINPNGTLIQTADGTLYGTSFSSGMEVSIPTVDSDTWSNYPTFYSGSIFQYSPASQQEAPAFVFGYDNSSPSGGIGPSTGLIQAADGNLYGSTETGGSAFASTRTDPCGTIFRYNPTSQVETVVHSFEDGSVSNDGDNPQAPLYLAADGNLYGTTSNGGSTRSLGSLGNGVLFMVNISTQHITVLHSFGDGSVVNDGIGPNTGLLQATGGDLFGSTAAGGAPSGTPVPNGVIYKYNPISKKVTTIHSFGDGTVAFDGLGQPSALMQATDGLLYGTTSGGGSAGHGAIFSYSPITRELITVHSFADGSVTHDGQAPSSGLIQATDGNLYGTTSSGGSSGQGVIYQYNLTSRQVSIVDSFDFSGLAWPDIVPQGVMQAADGNLYGLTFGGGAGVDSNYNAGGGTLFELGLGLPRLFALPLPPWALSATAGDGSVTLTWTMSKSATIYNVYAGTSAGQESSTPIAAGVTLTSETVNGLTGGKTYYFKVASVNAGYTSGFSNEATAIPLGAPAAPTHLVAAGGNARVTLTWTASPGAASYHVYRGTSAGGESSTALVVGITGTTFTNGGLTNGVTYYYRVAAVGNGLRSRLSNEAHATPSAAN